MFEMIKQQLAQSVPFVQHVGVVIEEVGPGTAVARLPSEPHLLNHIQTQHAGALFAVGETASGAAVVGAVAERVFSVRPIATAATIRYPKKAVGPILARAELGLPVANLLAQLDSDRRASFTVRVVMTDESEQVVAEMTVDWLVSQR